MDSLEFAHIKNNQIVHNLIVAIVNLVNEKPIEDISITDIVKRAHINRTTFYNYFTDKQSLINYVYYDVVKERETGFKRYDTYVQTVLDTITALSRYGSFITNAMQEERIDSLYNFVADYWIKFNQDLYKEATGEKTVPSDLGMKIEIWVHGLTQQMRKPSLLQDDHDITTLANLQLRIAPGQIRRILIDNSLKAGIHIQEMMTPIPMKSILTPYSITTVSTNIPQISAGVNHSNNDSIQSYQKIYAIRCTKKVAALLEGLPKIILETNDTPLTIENICSVSGISIEEYRSKFLSVEDLIHYMMIRDIKRYVQTRKNFEIEEAIRCVCLALRNNSEVYFKLFKQETYIFDIVRFIEENCKNRLLEITHRLYTPDSTKKELISDISFASSALSKELVDWVLEGCHDTESFISTCVRNTPTSIKRLNDSNKITINHTDVLVIF